MSVFRFPVNLSPTPYGAFNTNDLDRLIDIMPTSEPADADVGTSQLVMWVDEVGHTLNFKIRYSDGTTIKSGSIALT